MEKDSWHSKCGGSSVWQQQIVAPSKHESRKHKPPDDLQHLSDPKSVPTSSHDSLNYRTDNGFSEETRASLLPGALYPHNMGCRSLINGEFFPLLSCNDTAGENRGNRSELLQAEQYLNFQNSQVVGCKSLFEKDGGLTFCSMIENNNANTLSAKSCTLQNFFDVSLRKESTQSNFSDCNHGFNTSSKFPRVFCLDRSGNLLLCDSGHLGVVCSCHGFYMSVSKFSKHSGSSDINPGNAVHMENGETVAHWRETFFSKSEIRVMEDSQRGWEWPGEVSAVSHLGKHPTPTTSNNMVFVNQLEPFRTSVSYEKYSARNSAEKQNCRNAGDEYLYHERDRTSQDHNESLHAAVSMGTGVTNSFGINTEKTHQTTNAKFASISENVNDFSAVTNIHALRTRFNGLSVSKGTSAIVGGAGVSSNIELRLGLPPEQSQTLETRFPPAARSTHNGIHMDHPKELFCDQVLQRSNGLQRTKRTLQFADITSSPCEKRVPRQLDPHPPLLSNFRNPEAKLQFTNINEYGISDKLQHESRSAKNDKLFFPWCRMAGDSKELNANVSNAQYHLIKGKGVERAMNGLLGASKSSIEFSNTFKDDLSTLSVTLDETHSYSPASHEKSSNAYQMPVMVADESHGRNILNNCWKTSPLPVRMQFSHDKPIQTSVDVKEGKGSRASTNLFLSELNESCIFLKERDKFLREPVHLVASNIKEDKSVSFPWRDVPKKTLESCSLSRKEQQAGSFNQNLGNPVPDIARFALNGVSLEEPGLSNASSRCSAPIVAQESMVNKKDSFTVEGKPIRLANNFVLNEGSANETSWSSDDAPDNDHCADFFGSSKSNLISGGSFKVVHRKQSLSLLEDIRLLNSLISETAPYHLKRSSTIQHESDWLQKTEGGLWRSTETVKQMKLDERFPVSGQYSTDKESAKYTEKVGQNALSVWDMHITVGCDQESANKSADSIEQSFKKRNSAFSDATGTPPKRDLRWVYHAVEQPTEAHQSSSDDDTVETPEILRNKRVRLDDTSAQTKQTRQIYCSSAELTAKFTSLSCPSSSLGKSFKQVTRPLVFGKYGIICNGNPSKPTKIIPLRKILNDASLAERSRRNVVPNHVNHQVKSALVKVKKTSVENVKATSRNMKVPNNQVKKGASHDLPSIYLKPSILHREREIASSPTNVSDYQSHALKNSNKNYGISHSNAQIQLKTKSKEGWKRNLHEFLLKGNGFKVGNSSVMKHSVSSCQTRSTYWGELMKDAADNKVQIDEMNNAKSCPENQQPENSDMFSCVCGNSDKDEHKQSLECTRSIMKAHQSETESVGNDNINFYGRCALGDASCLLDPDSSTESLQPREEILTCARTEGYKGRKGEGVYHSDPQDTCGNVSCLVTQEQLNAWLHIHRQRPQRKGRPRSSSYFVESDCRKAYACYKKLKGWKDLVVYKSGIHALGLYTSQFIFQGQMVVEYVGEIVGLRVADRREKDYHSGKKLQHKSACYFFRVDKEHIIDATRKGGIARFVNHSCQPNCVAKVISLRNEKKVLFFAGRDIFPGEEITYDYHFNHEDEGDKITCYCKSKNCRRYLN